MNRAYPPPGEPDPEPSWDPAAVTPGAGPSFDAHAQALSHELEHAMIDEQTGPLEADALAEVAVFVRHLAWLAAPIVELSVQPSGGILVATFFEGRPQVEIDVDDDLSVGFSRVGDEYLVTSLCFAGLDGWPGTGRPRHRSAGLTADLLGSTASRAIMPMLNGGDLLMALPVAEADLLVTVWRSFVLGRPTAS